VALMLPQQVKFAAPMPKLLKFQTMPQLTDENKKIGDVNLLIMMF